MLAKEAKVLVSWYSFMLFFNDFLAIFSSDMQHWKQPIISATLIRPQLPPSNFYHPNLDMHNLGKNLGISYNNKNVGFNSTPRKNKCTQYKLRYCLEMDIDSLWLRKNQNEFWSFKNQELDILHILHFASSPYQTI